MPYLGSGCSHNDFEPFDDEDAIEKLELEAGIRELKEQKGNLKGKKNRHKRAKINKSITEKCGRWLELFTRGKPAIPKQSFGYLSRKMIREMRKKHMDDSMIKLKDVEKKLENLKKECPYDRFKHVPAVKKHYDCLLKLRSKIESNLEQFKELKESPEYRVLDDIIKAKPNRVRNCSACGKTLGIGKWQGCPCKRAWYCDPACQRKHWPHHKKTCTTFIKMKDSK